LELGGREIQVKVEAAPLERLGQLAGRVGGEHGERLARRLDGAQFRDGHREVAEHLQEQALDLDVGLVHLVHQEHGGLPATDRREQGAGQEELLREDVVARRVPALALAGLDAQDLLGVVPLVQGTGLVDALVALQSDEFGLGGGGDGLGELGLADARRALDEQRLAQPVGEVDDGGCGTVGEVALSAERLDHVVDALEGRFLRGSGSVHRDGSLRVSSVAGRTRSRWRQGRTCPVPRAIQLVLVSSDNPMGPRPCSFWVEIPISAPKPNISPSVQAVEALAITAAASTRALNASATSMLRVETASVCPEDQRAMWSRASSTPSTTLTAMSMLRYSSPQSVSSAGIMPSRSPWTVTPAAWSAPTTRSTAASPSAASSRTVSVALQTLQRRVWPLLARLIASSRSASPWM